MEFLTLSRLSGSSSNTRTSTTTTMTVSCPRKTSSSSMISTVKEEWARSRSHSMRIPSWLTHTQQNIGGRTLINLENNSFLIRVSTRQLRSNWCQSSLSSKATKPSSIHHPLQDRTLPSKLQTQEQTRAFKTKTSRSSKFLKMKIKSRLAILL